MIARWLLPFMCGWLGSLAVDSDHGWLRALDASLAALGFAAYVLIERRAP